MAIQQSADGVVRRCRAPQCRFVLACPWERDCRVSVCAGVFSPAVDHPSSVVMGSSLPHSPWPTSPVLTPPALIAPAAATCCKGSEEAEAEGVRGERTFCVSAPSVDRATFIFLNSWSYYIWQQLRDIIKRRTKSIIFTMLKCFRQLWKAKFCLSRLFPQSCFLGSATFSISDLLRAKDEHLTLSLR